MSVKNQTNDREHPFIEFPGGGEFVQQLLSYGDDNLKVIEQALNVKLSFRGERMFISGSPEHFELIKQLFDELYALVAEGLPVYPSDVEHALTILRSKENVRLRDIFLDRLLLGFECNPTAIKLIELGRVIAQPTLIKDFRGLANLFGSQRFAVSIKT